MAAIVTGEGIGLFDHYGTGIRPSLDTSGSHGRQHAVNVHTGQFVEQYTDKWLVGKGLNSALQRTYTSAGTYADSNGDDSYFSFEEHLEVGGSATAAVVRVVGDGYRQEFTHKEHVGDVHIYTSTAGDGAHDTLTFNTTTGAYEWLEGSSRVVHTYAAGSGAHLLLATRQDALGNVTYFERDGSDRVTLIWHDDEDAGGGRGLRLDYHGTTGRVNTIVEGRLATPSADAAFSADGTQVIYHYTDAGQLELVSLELKPDDNNNSYELRVLQTFYSYNDDGQVSEVRQFNGVTGMTSLTRLTYYTEGDHAGKVQSVEAGGPANVFRHQQGVTPSSSGSTSAGVAGVSVDTEVQRVEFVYGALSTTVRYIQDNGSSLDYTVTLDGAGRVVQTVSPSGSGGVLTTDYVYDTDGNLQSQTDSTGQGRFYLYDANGNAIREWNALGEVVEYAYNEHQQLTRTTQWMEAQPGDPTDLAGPLADQNAIFSGASRVSYRVYDDRETSTNPTRVRFAIEADGTVTQFNYGGNTNNSLVPAKEFVFLTAKWSGGELTYDAMIAWRNGEVDAGRTQIQRTNRLVNALGQVTSETVFAKADFGVTPDDNLGVTTTYVYDPVTGALLQRLEDDGTQTQYTVDAHGNALTATFSGDQQSRALLSTRGISTHWNARGFGGQTTAEGVWSIAGGGYGGACGTRVHTSRHG